MKKTNKIISLPSFWNTSAMLMLSVLAIGAIAMTTTTIQAYAQQQQQGGGKACPEGFELNRGVCQAEPETETVLVCPNNLPESPQGNCIVGVGPISNAICPSSHPFQYIGVEGCFNEAGETAPLVYQCPAGQEFDPSGLPENPRCFAVIPKVEQQSAPTCNNIGGVLNEESGLCEVKPGNNRV